MKFTNSDREIASEQPRRNHKKGNNNFLRPIEATNNIHSNASVMHALGSGGTDFPTNARVFSGLLLLNFHGTFNLT